MSTKSTSTSDEHDDQARESADAGVNTPAAAGTQTPERTPGAAPSVVPLPSGAAVAAGFGPGEHPLPEEAIEGYPDLRQLYDGTGGSAEGAAPVPDPVPDVPTADAPAPDQAPASDKSATGTAKTSTSSGNSSTGKTSTSK